MYIYIYIWLCSVETRYTYQLANNDVPDNVLCKSPNMVAILSYLCLILSLLAKILYSSFF